MNFEFKSINDLEQASGSSYGKFGKNDAKLVKFEYTSQGGSNGATQDALLVTFKVEDGEYNYRVFPAKVGNWINQDPNSEEYKKALQESQNQVQIAISQIVESIVDRTTIQYAIVAAKPTTFEQYVKLMERLIKAVPGWNNKELDLFLHWQSKLSPNQTRTYLEVPRQTDLKFGNSVFVTSKQPGVWNEVIEQGVLMYKDNAGNIHPFKRNKWFMEKSKFANRIVVEGTTQTATDSTSEDPTRNTW